MKLEIPEGMYELAPDDIIQKGDMWCIRETTGYNSWLPAKWDGHKVNSLAYNVYIRKATK